jgi:sulfur-carrier protein
MRLKVKLFAGLTSQATGTQAGVPFELDLPDASPVSELLRRLHLPDEGIRTVFVNGRSRSADYVLQDKDEVGIFPAIGGG